VDRSLGLRRGGLPASRRYEHDEKEGERAGDGELRAARLEKARADRTEARGHRLYGRAYSGA
jgi:hypothetical protein